jgi:hypothetical protein
LLSNAKAEAESQARETLEAARAESRRIVDDGMQRREDIEAVIADLVRRRDDVLADTEELSAKLTHAVSDHRPEPGTDEFQKPEDFDPMAREGSERPDEGEETAVVEAQPEPAESEHEADLRR